MFELGFSTGKGAFERRSPKDAARILRDIADRLERGELHGHVRDADGHSVGRYRLNAAPPPHKGEAQ